MFRPLCWILWSVFATSSRGFSSEADALKRLQSDGLPSLNFKDLGSYPLNTPGFHKQEVERIKSIGAEKNLKNYGEIYQRFKKSSLVQALLELKRGENESLPNLRSTWIDHRKLSTPLSVSNKDDDLVYLLEQNFEQLKNSKELQADSSKKQFSTALIQDFCEKEPGVKTPEDFVSKFSPWEFGVRLATGTQLEALLMSIAMNPDPFEELPEESFKEEDIGDEDVEEGAWESFLEEFDDRINGKDVSIEEVVRHLKKDQSVDTQIRRFLMAAAISAVELRKDCLRQKGQWFDLDWRDHDVLALFRCELNQDQKKIYLQLSIKNGDLEEGAIRYEWSREGLDLAAEHESLRRGLRVVVGLTKGDNLISDTWYNPNGQVQVLRTGGKNLEDSVQFFDSGLVEFHSCRSSCGLFQNVWFYASGKIRAYDFVHKDPAKSYYAQYYENGKVSYVSPLSAGSGERYWWFPSGKLAGVLERRGEKRWGSGKLFYENGIEGFSAEYADDRLYGTLVWRDPSGGLLLNLNFVDGKAQGPLEVQLEGRSLVKVRFEAGMVEGPVLVKDKSQKSVAELNYKSGLLHGTLLFKDSTGKTRVKSEWADGQLNGMTEAYFESGALASSCRFKSGRLTEWESKLPNGILRTKGTVKNLGEGSGEVFLYGGGRTPFLLCQTAEMSLVSCISLETRSSQPDLKELVKKASASEELKFKPEKCGGSFQSLDVSDLLTKKTGLVTLQVQTKELCRSGDLAAGLQCEIQLSQGRWSIKSCVLMDE